MVDVGTPTGERSIGSRRVVEDEDGGEIGINNTEVFGVRDILCLTVLQGWWCGVMV